MSLARKLNRRKLATSRKRNVGVTFVILEINVEVGLVCGDQISLEHKRLMLPRNHNNVETRGFRHQQRDLLARIGLIDVLKHAGAKIFGFSHINDYAMLIFPQITAGQLRHTMYLLGKISVAIARKRV